VVHGLNACPFCGRIEAGSVELRSTFAVAFPDGFPVSPGHTLVVPTRHQTDFFALSAGEQEDLWRLVAEVRQDLQERLSPNGFNIGLNDGEAAGQTVGHAHIHLIPRFQGDVPDPRGGVRLLFPANAAYWTDD
jgi:diadenosine tetraphosphate (Ap4A) HIT family hydrolase